MRFHPCTGCCSESYHPVNSDLLLLITVCAHTCSVFVTFIRILQSERARHVTLHGRTPAKFPGKKRTLSRIVYVQNKYLGCTWDGSYSVSEARAEIATFQGRVMRPALFNTLVWYSCSDPIGAPLALHSCWCRRRVSTLESRRRRHPTPQPTVAL